MSKAIYHGFDKRYNLYEMQEEGNPIATFEKQAKSVACLVSKEKLIQNNHYPYSYQFISNAMTLERRLGIDSEAKYAQEPCYGFGTAYYVGNKYYMLTAGHCVCKKNSNKLDDIRIKATRIVFGFFTESKGDYKTKFKNNEVYEIESVVAYEHSNGPDWALLKLKTKITGRDPLELCFSRLKFGTPVYMLGFPYGAPLKYAGEAKLLKKQDPNWFECDLDAFGGNSGSPIFDANTNKVIGILCAGNKDFDTTLIGASYHYVTHDEIQKKGYERCQRLSTIEDDISTYISNFSYPESSSYQPSYSTSSYDYNSRADEDMNWGVGCCLFVSATICLAKLLG